MRTAEEFASELYDYTGLAEFSESDQVCTRWFAGRKGSAEVVGSLRMLKVDAITDCVTIELRELAAKVRERDREVARFVAAHVQRGPVLTYAYREAGLILLATNAEIDDLLEPKEAGDEPSR